jgi:hypothetical protein
MVLWWKLAISVDFIGLYSCCHFTVHGMAPVVPQVVVVLLLVHSADFLFSSQTPKYKLIPTFQLSVMLHVWLSQFSRCVMGLRSQHVITGPFRSAGPHFGPSIQLQKLVSTFRHYTHVAVCHIDSVMSFVVLVMNFLSVCSQFKTI